jgi:hypothetical protein
MVGITDHGVVGMVSRGRLPVVIAVKVVTLFVEAIEKHPRHMAIFEEDVVNATGMIATLLATRIGGVGHDRMMLAAVIPIGYEPPLDAAMTERVTEVTPHRLDEFLKLRRADRRLELLERRNMEILQPPTAGTRHEHGAVIGRQPMFRNKRRWKFSGDSARPAGPATP